MRILASLCRRICLSRKTISKVSNMEDPLFIVVAGMMLLTVTIYALPHSSRLFGIMC